MKSEEFLKKAKDLVAQYAEEHLDVTDKPIKFDTYVVWFAYVLGSQKALISTTIPDGSYYEVTYNSTKNEIYLDVYKKFQNVCIRSDAE